ncbi:MAG TPA: GNAT family N-acetyltransferase [Gemmatimonadales bacterium]|nr:GNAT family N-acetyltransferase [Gemmatimonadales bacterium]
MSRLGSTAESRGGLLTSPREPIPTSAIPAIRRAAPTDAPALAALRFEFRSALDPAVESEKAFRRRTIGWMADRLLGKGCWHCWLAELAGETIGMAWLQLVEKLPNPVGEPEWLGYVTSVYVTPACRQRGIGAALLEAALSECDSRGVEAVILWPTPRSRPLYARHGFTAPTDLLQRRPAPPTA